MSGIKLVKTETEMNFIAEISLLRRERTVTNWR